MIRRRTLWTRFTSLPIKAYDLCSNYCWYRQRGHSRRAALDLAKRTIN